MDKNRILSLSGGATPAIGGKLKRQPFEARNNGRCRRVASWLSPTGEVRSLPTNVRAIPHTINVNSLRTIRFPSSMATEGVRSFSAAVAVDNFVEERSDKCYTSGAVPSIIRCKKMYQTESMERFNEALPHYRCFLSYVA
jgi:hypothetical protein